MGFFGLFLGNGFQVYYNVYYNLFLKLYTICQSFFRLCQTESKRDIYTLFFGSKAKNYYWAVTFNYTGQSIKYIHICTFTWKVLVSHTTT